MWLSLLAGRTEVKMLADTTLVSGPNDGKHVAPIALRFQVGYVAYLLLVNLVAIVELLEDLSALLFELFLD